MEKCCLILSLRTFKNTSNTRVFLVMKITLKLYASLAQFLPVNAVRNQVEVDIDPSLGLQGVLDSFGVPSEHCHLVLVNGIYVPPSERKSYTLSEKDSLAVWPPVAGG